MLDTEVTNMLKIFERNFDDESYNDESLKLFRIEFTEENKFSKKQIGYLLSELLKRYKSDKAPMIPQIRRVIKAIKPKLEEIAAKERVGERKEDDDFFAGVSFKTPEKLQLKTEIREEL